MTSKAFDNATDANRQQGGRRNLIINSNFDVWQRGTSFSSINDYTADRWATVDSGATLNVSRQSFTVGQTAVPNNPKYFLRYEVAAGNDNARIVQKIENVDVVAGQDITITYWAKLSSGTQPALEKSRIRQEFGSGGSSTVYQAGDAMPTLTSSWQKITQHFTVSSVAGKTIGTNDYFGVALLWQTDASTGAYTIDIAQVQLEVGTVATPFEHRSYGEELALCQRYYIKFIDDDSNAVFAVGQAYDSSTVNAPFQFPTEMRASPTGTINDDWRIRNSTGSSGTLENPTINTAKKYAHISAQRQNGGLVAGNAAQVWSQAGSLELDAEL